MEQKLLALFDKYRQFILYGIIGASGALIDVVFYYIFYKFLDISPVVASYLSVSLGILNNFILNSRHNFKVSDKMLNRFGRFYTIGIGGALLSSLIIFILYDLLGVDPLVSKMLTIPPVVILQYFLNKRFSFKVIPPTV